MFPQKLARHGPRLGVAAALGVLAADPGAAGGAPAAYAICVSGRLPGLRNVNGSPAVADSSFIKTATAYCPAGQQALGAGWWNFNDNINVVEQVLNIHANVWSGGVTGMASEDACGYGGNWSFTTIVTCADT